VGNSLYHCGPKGFSELDWLSSPKKVGTIGPGIYFTPHLDKVKTYCRKGFSLYEVDLKSPRGILQYRDLASDHPRLWDLLEPIAHENKPRWDVAWALGALVNEYGAVNFVRMMKPLGIVGTVGVFSSDTEYAIFDSSAYRFVAERDPAVVRVASRYLQAQRT
jgi:hypothetical protein